MTAFVAFVAVSVVSYLPMRLWFGDGAWFEPGHYPFPIQTSRILLYPAYFFTGVGIGIVGLRAGILAENGRGGKSLGDMARVCDLLFYGPSCSWSLPITTGSKTCCAAAVVAEPRMAWPSRSFSAAMAFTVPATSLRLSRSSLWLLDAMQPSAYGIFLFHYMFIIWLQYFVYDPAWPAGVKAAIVFAVTLGGSWLLTVLLRKIPLVARTI